MSSTAMMNGFGFSRFMVQTFQANSNATATSKATSTVTTVSSDDTDRSRHANSALSPDALSHRSTAEADAELDHGTDEPRNNNRPLPHHVQLSFERVARVARDATRRVDWRQLRNSTAHWDDRSKLSASPNFRIFTRQSRGMHYVMAVGTLACSPAEVASILRPTTDATYRTAMTQLYGNAFVDGAIRYQSPPDSRVPSDSHSISTSSINSINRSDPATRSGRSGSTAPLSMAPGADSQSTPMMTPSDFTAKTATFAPRTRVFGKAHQWTFLESVERTADGFTIALSSLRPDCGAWPVHVATTSKREWSASIANAAVSTGPVEHIQGVTAAYSVASRECDGSSANGGNRVLQVTFYATFADDSTSFGPLKRHTFKLALRSHLLHMARATTRLSVIVRRKRLEAFARAANSVSRSTISAALCVCCTATLHFLRAKTRCYACNYWVCDKCAIEHEVEDESDRSACRLARVCQRCIRRIEQSTAAGDELFARASLRQLPAVPPALTHQRSGAARSNRKAMAMWDRTDHTPNPETTHATLTKYVLDEQRHQTEQQLQAPRLLRSSSLSSLASSLSSLASSLMSPVSLVDNESFALTYPAADRDSHHNDSSSSGYRDSQDAYRANTKPTTRDRNGVWIYDEDDSDCTPSNTTSSTNRSRSAAVPYQSASDIHDAVADFTGTTDRTASQPSYPVPRNEAHRSKMAQQQLARLTDASSLEIICAIASQELQCSVAMVTLVAGSKTHIVAANCATYCGVVVPRSESLCAHTVMRDDAIDRLQPLIVQQPALDPRFRNLAIVRQRGLQFYCGFPLTSDDGSVVGALCCGDFAAGRSNASQCVLDLDAAPLASPAMTLQQRDAMVKLAATASRVMQLHGKQAAYKRL